MIAGRDFHNTDANFNVFLQTLKSKGLFAGQITAQVLVEAHEASYHGCKYLLIIVHFLVEKDKKYLF